MSKKSSSSKYLRFLKALADNTVESYFQSIRKYEEFHGISIEELIDEALDEQENQVPHHKLSLIDRLEDFQEELINQGLVHGTIVHHLGMIKTIYHKNRVEIPYITPLNPKRTKRREYIEFKDILTKEEIKKALEHMRLPARARAITMAQGGLSNEECEHLTTRQFIDDLYKYHQCDDDVDALEWLSDENHPVIWVARLTRIKTGKPYYASIGAEAVNVIASAKLYEKGLKKNNGEIPDKLLNIHKNAFVRLCRSISNKLGLPKVAEESKFRSHNLRRFHATYIKGSALSYEENSLITNAEIDEMQGRGKTNVQDTYIKTSPLRQKALYAKVMNNVSLFHKYDYAIVDGDVMVWIEDPTIETVKLRERVKKLEKTLAEKRDASDKVKALREEMGDDAFNELIGEILSVS